MTNVDVKLSTEEIKRIEEVIISEMYPNGYKITENQINSIISFLDAASKGKEGEKEGLVEVIRLMSALEDNSPEQTLEDKTEEGLEASGETHLSCTPEILKVLLRHPAAELLIGHCVKEDTIVIRGKKEIIDVLIDIYEKI